MSLRTPPLRAISCLLPISKAAPPTLSIAHHCQSQRQVHHLTSRSAPRIPSPTPFVPDAATFLTLIGRNLSQHASKIPTWEALFSLTSPQFRELGIEPPRSRRYLLRWREKFRNGEFGVGGRAREVVDGVAELRVVEVPGKGDVARATATRTPGMKRVVVNVPVGKELGVGEAETAARMSGVWVKGASRITGPWVQPVGKGVARIKVQEGLWEVKRGHKIDGGERRQAEVRAKKRKAERETTRK